MEGVSFKSHLIRLLLILGILSSLLRLPTNTVEAEFNLQDWEFSKPLSLPASLNKKEHIKIIPDPDVYSHALSGLVDLRIIEDGTQREVPYKLLVERGADRRESVPVDIIDLGHVPGSHTSFVAHIGSSGAVHNEIELNTTSQGFLRKIKLESSQDQIAWTVIVSESQIYDLTTDTYTSGPRSTKVSYPDSAASFLKITIFDDGNDPINISGAYSFFVRTTAPQYEAYSVTVLSKGDISKVNTTEAVIDLGSENLPSSRLSISVPEVNFYRRTKLETSDDAEEWTMLQQNDALYVYDMPKLSQSKVTVDYPEVHSRYLRLTLFNEDSPPLNLDGVDVSRYRRQLIFEADNNITYRLYYGSPIAKAPSYDLEHIFPYLVTEDLAQANLGQKIINSSFIKKSAEPVSDRYPWLLPTVVAVLAMGLGLFLMLKHEILL